MKPSRKSRTENAEHEFKSGEGFCIGLVAQKMVHNRLGEVPNMAGLGAMVKSMG